MHDKKNRHSRLHAVKNVLKLSEKLKCEKLKTKKNANNFNRFATKQQEEITTVMKSV